LSIGSIQSAVAAHYDVAVSDMVSSSRAARIAWPRQVAIYLSRELTTTPLQAIGHAFGGRNHATVLHACKRVSDRLLDDQYAGADLEELKAAISSSGADRRN
jgi:chromosomal replication initiator protein